jgi:tetratricopeptide (TPR) repeat protein
LAVILIGAIGCTTKRDGVTYRLYHNTTSRYNGFFYATESVKEGVKKITASHQDDYDYILPVFIYGSEEDAQKAFPEMERAIEKSTKVIQRHRMDPPDREKKKMKRPVMNKWIDDNFLVVGKAQFYKQSYYKAQETFGYCSRQFTDPEIIAATEIWLARTNIELKNYTKARQSLEKAENQKKLPDHLKAELNLVYADYHLRQENYEKASQRLEAAISSTKKKRDRARPTFILAQVQQELGNSQRAIDLYEMILQLKAPYEMEFYAQINQAMAFNRRSGNSDMIITKLKKMLADDKNAEYRDQIHYAMAEIYLEDQQKSEVRYHLNESIAENTKNKKQRGKTYLKLGDFHFEEKEYEYAQAYYDSCTKYIPETHPRYADVMNKAKSLTELVTHLNIIALEDSLQALAKLSPSELDKKINKIIQREIEEEERKIREAEEAARQGAKNTESGSTWWAWNPSLLETGKKNFQNRWGDRPLEDHWRRSSKMGSFSSESDSETEPTADAGAQKGGKQRDPEEYKKNIPFTEEQLTASDERIKEAFYKSGLVYKENLSDFENAVAQWEELVTRYDESDFHMLAYYQLYRSYYAKEQEGYRNPFCSTCNSKYWGDLVVEKYPDSEYAELVRNPEYKSMQAIKEARERDEYDGVLTYYRNKNYPEVVSRSNEVIGTQPDNHLKPKYMFLRALSIGSMERIGGTRDNYIAALKEIKDTYPDTEEGKKASEMLAELLGESEKPKKEEKAPEKEKDKPSGDDIYTFNRDSELYFALIFGRDDANLNDIKAKTADFNTVHFQSASLKVSSNLLNKDMNVVLVKSFMKFEDGTAYWKAFTNNKDALSEVNVAGIHRVLISKENYIQLFKTKELEAYLGFFDKYYKDKK